MIGSWLYGLARTRGGRLFGMATGIALAVALLADLGTFIEHSASTMTARAIVAIPVDWQVELVRGASIETVSAAIEAAMPTKHSELVGYADVDSFELTTPSGQLLYLESPLPADLAAFAATLNAKTKEALL